MLYNSLSNFDEINDFLRYNRQYSLNESGDFYKVCGTKRLKLKNRYFICDYCYTSPKFSFKGNKIHLKCDCKKLDELIISDFIRKYTTHEKKVLENYLYCQKHKSKYEYYCKYCRVNLCKDCLLEDMHKNHYPENLLDDDIEDIIDKIKDKIKDIRKNVSVGDIENRKILNIILTLIKSYKECPCHNLHKSITDFLEYLEKKEIPKIKTYYKIISKNQLFEIIFLKYLKILHQLKLMEKTF